jgi:hypothetical protein
MAAFLMAVWCWFLVEGARKSPEISGSLVIQCGSADRIFIGNRLAGTGSVSISWSELLNSGTSAGIISLDGDAVAPTVELLADPGAEELRFATSGGCRVRDVAVTVDEWSVRRKDGALDQVFAIVIDLFRSDPAKHRHLLLPLRMRAEASKPASFFLSSGNATHSITNVSRFPFVNGILRKRQQAASNLIFRFQAGSRPAESAKECIDKGVWEPEN